MSIIDVNNNNTNHHDVKWISSGLSNKLHTYGIQLTTPIYKYYMLTETAGVLKLKFERNDIEYYNTYIAHINL